jgi:hypothetical protein
VGAGLAFQAALDRYRREDLVLLSYHVHIPLPDPMVNPSTLARQAFYAVRSSPSYFVDGESSGGGGGAEQARMLFESKIDPLIAKHMEEQPEADISLKATTAGSTVKVKTTVSKITSKSDKLRLQIVLVEDQVPFSGENGMRFHEMVVRSLAGVPTAPVVAKKPEASAPADKPAATPAADKAAAAPAVDTVAAAPAAAKPPAPPPSTGFALKPGKGGTFEYSFDLAKAVADARAHLEDYETNTRKGEYSFRRKMHEIDASKLSVVAFVQDEATKKILQAVYVKAATVKKTTN